jgi:TonB-dependent SusC/RagA subfamily outer membrane receptor
VDVIKDGTAAIYGHRGANGVILVKTKRAKN